MIQGRTAGELTADPYRVEMSCHAASIMDQKRWAEISIHYLTDLLALDERLPDIPEIATSGRVESIGGPSAGI